MFNNDSQNHSIRNIIVATILFVLYIVFVAFPFFAATSPQTEASLEWAYNYAPIHYAMIYFPAFAIYVYSILKNILAVRYIRSLIYPIVFIILFVAVHMVFFVFSAVILWFAIITIPVGFIVLVAIEMLAIYFDIKDRKQNGEINFSKNSDFQMVLDILGKFVIPLLLFGICLLCAIMTVFMPKMILQAEQERALQCERNKHVIQTALNNLNIDINNASYEEISAQFQKEFSKNDIYEPLLGKKYDKVEANTGDYFSEFQFSTKDQDSIHVEDIYTFEKKNEHNEYNIWATMACKILINENGKFVNN